MIEKLTDAKLHEELRRAELGVIVSDYANKLRDLEVAEVRVHALINYQQVLELQAALKEAERMILTQQANLNILLSSPTIEEIS